MIQMPATPTPILPSHAGLKPAGNIRAEFVKAASKVAHSGAMLDVAPQGLAEPSAQTMRQPIGGALFAQTRKSPLLVLSKALSVALFPHFSNMWIGHAISLIFRAQLGAVLRSIGTIGGAGFFGIFLATLAVMRLYARPILSILGIALPRRCHNSVSLAPVCQPHRGLSYFSPSCISFSELRSRCLQVGMICGLSFCRQPSLIPFSPRSARDRISRLILVIFISFGRWMCGMKTGGRRFHFVLVLGSPYCQVGASARLAGIIAPVYGVISHLAVLSRRWLGVAGALQPLQLPRIVPDRFALGNQIGAV